MNLRRDVFQAIADPTRRAIVLLLATQSMTAGAIASKFQTARPTGSRHLQILTTSGVIEQEKNGRVVCYQHTLGKKKEIGELIEPFPRHWEKRMKRLEII